MSIFMHDHKNEQQQDKENAGKDARQRALLDPIREANPADDQQERRMHVHVNPSDTG